MLRVLHIENIAVIERSDIVFETGLNVLTGETGAGKSILIDAIGAVLGERTSKELIRAGCESAYVSAVFDDPDEETLRYLRENDLEPEEDGSLLIERKLSASGKGLMKVGGRPVAAALIREIGKNLINIHGQHDNQALLDSENHCAYLDALANDEKERERYYQEFRTLNGIRKELKARQMDEEEKRRETDLLQYQIKEIEDAALQVGEYAKLKENLKIAKNYEATLAALSKAYAALAGNEDAAGAESLLTDAAKAIRHLRSEDWEKQAEKIDAARSVLTDVRAALTGFLDDSELRQLDADRVSARLDILDRLMVKYGNSEEEMLAFLEKAKERLAEIETNDQKIEELSALLEESTERLIARGEELTAVRKKTAAEFERRICDVLTYLNMPNVQFCVSIEKGRYTKNGCDEVAFLISANQGEEVKALKKIASGGELSRVMLAIKSVLLDHDPVGSMIFDEIDTGISGYTAGKVAVQLGKVAKSRQVICVTHLPQIAARASHHFLIEKTERGGRTFTEVDPIDGEERIEEIARLMSGTQMTENLYNSAKELLDRSKQDDDL